MIHTILLSTALLAPRTCPAAISPHVVIIADPAHVAASLVVKGEPITRVGSTISILHGSAKSIALHVRCSGSAVTLKLADAPSGFVTTAQNYLSIALTILVPRHASLSARTGNGDATITGVRGSIAVTSALGRITIRDSGPRVYAEDANGSIALATGPMAGTPRIDLTSKNGAISLDLPRGYATHVRARAVNGAVLNPFANYPGPATITLTTKNGAIRVRN